MNRCTILEEYKLIELPESKIHGAWKGGHLLLFFMAFVFGSFCTFCFHMLQHIFDDKCVLFPSLVHATEIQQQRISDIFPIKNAPNGGIPVDFVSTKWVERSTCYLPMYVPLVSGLFGLVWTTMFLMCTSGSGTMAGIQRPWRILPFVILFSLAMSGVCIYATYVTQAGLNELCNKLAEATGADSCSYTINVATLLYERRMRGIYQATQLTILLAWLHTICWITSALLAVVRILVAADFQLVRITVDVVGDIEKMLEQQEKHLYTVFPDDGHNLSLGVLKLNTESNSFTSLKDVTEIYVNPQRFISRSHSSLVPDEKRRLQKFRSLQKSSRVLSKRMFILKLLNDLIDAVPSLSNVTKLERQEGQVNFYDQAEKVAGTNKLMQHSKTQNLSQQPESNAEKAVVEFVPSTSKSARNKHVTIKADNKNDADDDPANEAAETEQLQIDETLEEPQNSRGATQQTERTKKEKQE